MRPKVVITGMGVVSALGIGAEANLSALLRGESGVRAVRYLPTEHREFPVGEVPMSGEELRQRLSLPAGIYSRTHLLGVLALQEALEQPKRLVS